MQVAEQLASLGLRDDSAREGAGAAEGVPDATNPPVLSRWPEFTGAFLLYFICIPPTPQVATPLPFPARGLPCGKRRRSMEI